MGPNGPLGSCETRDPTRQTRDIPKCRALRSHPHYKHGTSPNCAHASARPVVVAASGLPPTNRAQRNGKIACSRKDQHKPDDRPLSPLLKVLREGIARKTPGL